MNTPQGPPTLTGRILSSRRMIVALTLLYLAVLWSAIWVELRYDREKHLKGAYVDADNLVHAYARSVDTTMRAIDTALQMLRNQHLERPDKFDETAQMLLNTTLRGIVVQIGRVDGEGRLVYALPPSGRLPLDVSDRPHVRAHLGQIVDRLFVAPVLMMRTTGVAAVPVTRPIPGPDGRAVGVVTMLLSPLHLAELQSGIKIGRTGVVELYRDGDMLMARGSPLQTATNPIGQRIARGPAESVDDVPIETSPIDGVRRIVAERHDAALPLSFRVGLGEAEVLQTHQLHVRELILAGVVLSALLFLANSHLLRLDAGLRRSRARAAASEARLRGIIENIDVVTWELDLPSRRWTFVSPQAERMFGYPLDDWLDDPDFWADHVHADDRDAAVRLRTERTADRQDHDFEYRFVARDGRTVWVRDIVKVICDERGRPLKLTGVMVDISAQAQAEQALLAEKALLASLIDTIPDLIFFKDTAGVYLGGNAAFQQFVGRPATDLRGRTDFELFERAQAEFFCAMDHLMLQSGKMRRNEEWVSYPDGRRLLLDTVKTPFRDTSGKPLGLIGVSRDITELKQNQEQLRLAKTVFDVTTEAIVVTDARGAIVSVNAAFVAISGWPVSEALGNGFELLQADDHDASFDAEMQARLRTSGHWTGEIALKRRNGEPFAARLSIATVRDAAGRRDKLVHVFGDITQMKRHEQDIWRQANFDFLTGLANRNHFMARLGQALAASRRSALRVGLLFIDLDRFKWVNDTLGHDAGDEVLIEAARRLRGCTREVDTVARLGGDEFTIIVEGLDSAEPLAPLADKVIAALSAVYRVAGSDQYLSCSVGITVFPSDASNASDLVRNADIAMYRAKEAGRGRHATYSPTMQSDALARVHVEQALRKAIDDDTFVIEYQPIVDASDGALVGAEALLRLDDGQGGRVEPSTFIAVAEESGLIAGVGERIVEAACAQWRAWLDATGVAVPLTINVAGIQLGHPALHTALVASMQRHRVGHGQVTLDVPEPALLEHTHGAAAALDALQHAGVSLAVDGFGSGYASLSCLQQCHVAAVKLDRTLVARLPGDAQAERLVDAIIRMAHLLDIRVVAVGVEHAAQRDLLCALGCDQLQGFLTGRPVDGAAFGALILHSGTANADALTAS